MNKDIKNKLPWSGVLSSPLVEKARGLPLVWVIPLVALAVGVWLAFQTLSSEGPTITIVFKGAPGLEAGKSKVKYKDVDVGLIKSIELGHDLSNVIVTVKMEKNVANHLGENTAFWVVKPQLGMSGVSGLDTLLAGNYISVEFAPGERRVSEFQGLEEPPRVRNDAPGRSFMLMAEYAGPIQYGTGIYYRDIQVGQVVNLKLSEDKNNVAAEIFLNAPYDQLVRDDSRFWLTSGLDFSMDAKGVNLKVGSMVSLVSGGISFDSPSLTNPQSSPSNSGREFRLHKDHTAVADGSYVHKSSYLIYFKDSVRGLVVGAPVEIKGLKVGIVTDIKMDVDFDTGNMRIPVTVEFDLDRLNALGMSDKVEKFEEVHKLEVKQGLNPGVEDLVEHGLRAKLRSGNLLTGQLYVDVDFYPDAPPAKIIYGGLYPELPTMPSTASQLERNVIEIVANFKKIPLDKIGQELLGVVQGSNRLINSPELKSSVRSLDVALKDVHQLSQTADRQMVSLAGAVEKSLGSAIKVLEQLEPGAPMASDLNHALEELSASARSIRALTDYLERHPEALLQGKSGAAKR